MDELEMSAAYIKGFEACKDKLDNALKDLQKCAIDSNYDFDYGNYELVITILEEQGLS